MKRITVVGSGGAGKSTLSRQLGEILRIEVFHLDKLYWQPGWVEISRDQLRSKQQHIVEKQSWIIDGNYGSTMDVRLERADTIIFLDLPRLTCMYRIVKRRWMYHNKTRPDITEGCNEQLDPEFVRWVWDFKKNRRPALLERLSHYESHKNVIILKTKKEVANFLQQVKADYVH